MISRIVELQIAAMSMCPPAGVINVFEQLADEQSFPADMDDLLDDFPKTYIGMRKGRHATRRVPLYPIDTWNVHNRTIEGLSHNNNCRSMALGFRLSGSGALSINLAFDRDFTKRRSDRPLVSHYPSDQQSGTVKIVF